MKTNSLFTKVLAWTGSVMVVLPILFMLFTGVAGSIMSRQVLMDYMMPAEMFPFVLVGAAAVIWAAFRAHRFTKPLLWTAGAALFLLIACQVLAVLTGLASGKLQSQDAPALMVLVVGMLIGYDLGVVLLGYLGIRLSLLISVRTGTPQA